MILESLIGERGARIVADVMTLGAAFVAVVGMVRVAYTRRVGAWPRNALTLTIDVLVDIFTNIPGALNKLQSASGGSPLMTSPEVDARDAEIAMLRARVADLMGDRVAQRDTVAPPAPIDPLASHRTTIPGGQSGRASVAVLALIAAVSVAGLAACPRLPERVGCAEGTRACVEGAPHVCDGDGRYHRAGDLACAAVGGVCVSSDGRAWCAPGPVDGGAVTDAGGVE